MKFSHVRHRALLSGLSTSQRSLLLRKVLINLRFAFLSKPVRESSVGEVKRKGKGKEENEKLFNPFLMLQQLVNFHSSACAFISQVNDKIDFRLNIWSRWGVRRKRGFPLSSEGKRSWMGKFNIHKLSDVLGNRILDKSLQRINILDIFILLPVSMSLFGCHSLSFHFAT